MILAIPDFEGVESMSESNTMFPGILDDEQWIKVYTNAKVNCDSPLQMIQNIIDHAGDTINIYVKDNTIYKNSNEGKYKMTIPTEEKELIVTDILFIF